ncbi:hypothetical protein E5161_05985 [Cohnella pontilimi]|uniref:Uncharacterized protein n=1 Tax=Cohnella pontilimi TaxID=2564100 RepID=A0A4U0FIZ7_9BACL|nr:hypothetical protein [Cohnella pontilimi]TJY43432.1 hypothetical protein E5161_05985 [Cohnella pontilimi]
MDIKEKKKLCKEHMYRYVAVHLADGSSYDGIVEFVDDHWLRLAVPGAVQPASRAYFPVPYTDYFGPWGYYGGFYPYPRRFAALLIPLAALQTLLLLPYFW